MPPEDIRFLHSPSLPGVTVLNARQTERDWNVINSDYGLAVPRDWVAQIRYRGRSREYGAGDVFLTEPGEVHSTQRIVRRGAFDVVMFEPTAMSDYLSELRGHQGAFSWRHSGASISPQLASAHANLVRVLGAEESALSIQSAVGELVSMVAADLLEGSSPRVLKSNLRAVERARECLHDDDDRWIDLTTLSEKAGLSRFHLLREFKQHYGLPPHAYQIRVRVAKAQEMLRKGLLPAHVATECGFADQSHLTRHFKRVLGITPKQFFLGHGVTRHG